MRRPRITIAALLGLVAFVAVAFAALRHPTEAWDSGVFGLLLLVLLTSMLLAVHRSGGRRSFWLGFSLFGWAYLGLSLVPPVEARLPTTRGLNLLSTLLSPLRSIDLNNSQDSVVRSEFLNSDGSPKPGVVLGLQPMSGRLMATMGGSTEKYLHIGHSLMTLGMAFLGAQLSRYLFASGRDQPAEDSVVSPI